MNYFYEIKAFYDRLELNQLSSSAIALWHALAYIANKTDSQEFTVASSILKNKAGLSDSSFKRARNALRQSGLVDWKSRGSNLSSIYCMKILAVHNEPQSEPQTEPQSEPQTEPQSEPINKHNITKLNNTKELPKGSKKKFVPPTVEEVQAYCSERNNNVDAERFVNFYQSKGWKVGKNSMTDWKASVRTWENNQEGGKVVEHPRNDAKAEFEAEYDRMLAELYG